MTQIPRPEYPRPQIVRDTWLNLNGAWEFEIDPGASGPARGVQNADQSRRDDHRALLPREQALGHRQHGLHAGRLVPPRGRTIPPTGRASACCCTSARSTTSPRSGSTASRSAPTAAATSRSTPRSRGAVKPGKNVITICAEDDTRSPLQPTGKQSDRYESYGCYYTRTTGIWQTVWLEAVPADLHRAACSSRPTWTAASVLVEAQVDGPRPRRRVLRARRWPKASAVGDGRGAARATARPLLVTLSETRAPGRRSDPFLYDLQAHARDATAVGRSRSTSYFGLRTVAIDGHVITAQRQAGLPAPDPRPGLLSRRHLHRADRRGACGATSS